MTFNDSPGVTATVVCEKPPPPPAPPSVGKYSLNDPNPPPPPPPHALIVRIVHSVGTRTVWSFPEYRNDAEDGFGLDAQASGMELDPRKAVRSISANGRILK